MKKVIVFSAIMIFSFMTASHALTVTGKAGTMLRSAPDGKIITKLDKGTDLEFTGKQDKKWIHVTTQDGKSGWVFLKNTDFAGDKKAAKSEIKAASKKAHTETKAAHHAKEGAMKAAEGKAKEKAKPEVEKAEQKKEEIQKMTDDTESDDYESDMADDDEL